MYTEIEDILLGKQSSKWTSEEIKEVWEIVYPKTLFNKRGVKKLCRYIKEESSTLRHPDPGDNCKFMWAPIFLFTNFKKLPLFINHTHPQVRDVVKYRLERGK